MSKTLNLRSFVQLFEAELERLAQLISAEAEKENAALACIAKILVCIVQCFKRSAAEVNSPALMLKCFES